MKPFENVFAPRNGATGVADSQHDVGAVALRADPDSSAGAIVLSSVLQKILYNQAMCSVSRRSQKGRSEIPFQSSHRANPAARQDRPTIHQRAG